MIIPNPIWAKHQLKGYTPQNESKVLLVFERGGRILVTGTALMFSDYNPGARSAWTLWLIAAAILMFLYEGWWIRYFRSQRTPMDLYSSFCGVPVAGATMPVAAFFLLGVYGKVVWLMISAAILGIGHIGISLQHRREAREQT